MPLSGVSIRILLASGAVDYETLLRETFAPYPSINREVASSIADVRARLEQDQPDVLLVDGALLDEDALTWLRTAPPLTLPPVLLLARGNTAGPLFERALAADVEDVLVTSEQHPLALAHAVRLALDRRRFLQHMSISERMEAVGRFMSGVTHDFSNLLTVILGATDRMQAQLPPGHPLANDCQTIRTSASRAVSLARQLLSYSRQQSPERVALNLGELVRSNESIVRVLAGERVTVVIESEAVHVVADRTHLEQVLFNLVANARDAMPTGGQLTIATRAVEAPPEEDGDRRRRAALVVTDTGVGMDAETRARAFDLFFTTKDAGRGTGLGLNSVYRIAREAGGSVDIASSPGSGTTVRVLLPLVEAVEQAVTSHRPAAPAIPVRGSETVLVVEDEEAVRELVVDMLESAGFTALGVGRPLVALQACRDYEGAIDLLLTDIVMPEMSGLELAQKVRTARPGTRVLFMSGYADHSELPGGSLDEHMRLVQKPFDSLGLVTSVRAALDADDASGLVAVQATQGT